MMDPSSRRAALNAGAPGRSPGGTAMLAGKPPLAHRQPGRLGAARRSARKKHDGIEVLIRRQA
jgi:hypothetical protein